MKENLQQQEGPETTALGPKGKSQMSQDSGFISQLKSAMSQTPQAQEMAQLQAGADQYTAQLKPLRAGKFNMAGEEHPESNKRREYELDYAKEKLGGSVAYEREHEHEVKFGSDPAKKADPPLLRVAQNVFFVEDVVTVLMPLIEQMDKLRKSGADASVVGNLESQLVFYSQGLMKRIAGVYKELADYAKEETDPEKLDLIKAFQELVIQAIALYKDKVIGKDAELSEQPLMIAEQVVLFYKKHLAASANENQENVRENRSVHMHTAANHTPNANVLWKVGDKHIADIKGMLGDAPSSYELLTRREFNDDFLAWAESKGLSLAPEDEDDKKEKE